jgi:hypothetical protein
MVDRTIHSMPITTRLPQNTQARALPIPSHLNDGTPALRRAKEAITFPKYPTPTIVNKESGRRHKAHARNDAIANMEMFMAECETMLCICTPSAQAALVTIYFVNDGFIGAADKGACRRNQ